MDKIFSQEQIDKIMQSAEEQAIASVVEGLASAVTYEARNAVQGIIKEHINDWLADNVLPEITKQLVKHKEGLIQIGVTVAPKIVEAVATSMVARMSEQLSCDYKTRDILKSLFGIR